MHTCTVVEQNKAIITYVQLLKEDLAIFRLVPDNGVVPEYDAGQFITIGMPIPSEGGKIIRRAYSIASHPENRKYVELVIRWVRKPLPGRLTTELFNAKEGNEITWIKPTGAALEINEKLHDGKKDTRPYSVSWRRNRYCTCRIITGICMHQNTFYTKRRPYR